MTSFRPKHHGFRDETVLTTVRPISDLGELYNQFFESRVENFELCCRDINKELRDTYRNGRRMSTKDMKEWIKMQQINLHHMDKEIVDDELVTKGCIDESHLFSEFSKSKHKDAEQKPAEVA